MSQRDLEGKKAPLFTGTDQDGNKITLKDYIGKKVILYFYPHDMTPTCTVQACNLRDAYVLLGRKGVQVIGVSTDDPAQHRKFIAKNSLPFPLIADTDLKINKKYGVWQLKKFMGREFMGTVRTTFLINEKGIIEHIIRKPKSKIHSEEIMQLWDL
ncbi:MAG: thioredoxin-dependent thiol peroxidase [Taibaiella sp.]|nr:thioredoxin-dependent thiol peroxidase [Taibaiella sp.]